MPAKSTFSIGVTETAVVVRVVGRGTREHAPAFISDVTAVIRESSEKTLIVDVDNCEYLDSTFLGCLVVLFKRSDSQMCVSVSESQRDHLFSSARIDRMIPVRQPDTVETPDQWHSIAAESESNAMELGKRVAEAHRCLADVEGPNAAVYRDVADRLDAELRVRRPK